MNKREHLPLKSANAQLFQELLAERNEAIADSHWSYELAAVRKDRVIKFAAAYFSERDRANRLQAELDEARATICRLQSKTELEEKVERQAPTLDEALDKLIGRTEHKNQIRQIVATLQEEKVELEQTINDQTEQITELQQMNKEQREALRRNEEKQQRENHLKEHRRRILQMDYKQIEPSGKLLALALLDIAADTYWDLDRLCEPIHPIMERLAKQIGLSEDTLSRLNDSMTKAGAWTYSAKRTFLGRQKIGKKTKEIYHTEGTVTLEKILTAPEEIEKPLGPKGTHHGGDAGRSKRCKAPGCESDDLDNFGAEYCRSCQKVYLKRLPGLRGDANVDELIAAIKRDDIIIQDHLHSYAHQDDDEQQNPKHDAFTSEDLTQIDQELEELTSTPIQEHNAPVIEIQDQKHDAPVKEARDQEHHAPATTIVQNQEHHAPAIQAPAQLAEQNSLVRPSASCSEKPRCGHCGEVWEPVYDHPSGRPLCACWRKEPEEVKRGKIPTQIVLI